MRMSGILLASDLDGTLLATGHRVTPETRAAIERFMRDGGRFAVATGRAPCGFEVLRPHVPMNTPAIMGNGAVLYDYDEDKVLEFTGLQGDYLGVCREVMETFPEVAVEAHFVHEVAVVCQNEYSVAHMQTVELEPRVFAALEDIPPRWLKALFTADTPILKAVADWFSKRYGDQYDLVFSYHYLLEMQDKQANKGDALRRLMARLGFDRAHTFAVGDERNDLPMLRAVTSFAPQSAHEDVLATVDHIMPDRNNHAVAAVIDWLYANV